MCDMRLLWIPVKIRLKYGQIIAKKKFIKKIRKSVGKFKRKFTSGKQLLCVYDIRWVHMILCKWILSLAVFFYIIHFIITFDFVCALWSKY